MEHNSKLTEYHIFSDSEYNRLATYEQGDLKKVLKTVLSRLNKGIIFELDKWNGAQIGEGRIR